MKYLPYELFSSLTLFSGMNRTDTAEIESGDFPFIDFVGHVCDFGFQFLYN